MLNSQIYHTKPTAELQQMSTRDLLELKRQSFARRWHPEDDNTIINKLDRRYNRGQRDLQARVIEILAQRSN